jgi:hypothetical protein
MHLERRQKLVQRQENFRLVTCKEIQQSYASKSNRKPVTPRTPVSSPLPSPQTPASFSNFDPFDTLAVDSSRLQTLLGHCEWFCIIFEATISKISAASASQAVEPVFSISNRFPFQSFRAVFRAGFEDPALISSLLLSLLLARKDGRVDAEFLACKSQTIRYINNNLASPLDSSVNATIGAILLLIGVEARLGVRSHVQIHLHGVMDLLRLLNSKQVYLSGGIKRAIFWQDLNAALTTGVQRILSHDVFPELHWRRDPIFCSFYSLPAGFAPCGDMLSNELIEALEDIHALQLLRNVAEFNPPDAVTVHQLDNQQAWIESRLHQCYCAADPSNYALISCIIAAYLCTYSLFSEVWAGRWIPSHCSSRLLRSLQQAENGDCWVGHEELLVWLLFTGGTFAEPDSSRSEYAVLLHGNQHARIAHLLTSWSDVQELLKTFIWSESLFFSRGKDFWEACCFF